MIMIDSCGTVIATFLMMYISMYANIQNMTTK